MLGNYGWLWGGIFELGWDELGIFDLTV